MAEIISSLGATAATHKHNVLISSISGSDPWTIDLLDPHNANLGDTLSDESANIYLITQVTDLDTVVVTDAFGMGVAPENTSNANVPFIDRTYDDQVEFEADLDNSDMYAATDSPTGEMYDDADFSGDTECRFGLTTQIANSSQTVTVKPASGEGHDGSPGTGVEIVKTTSLAGAVFQSDYSSSGPVLSLEGLEVDGGGEISGGNWESCIYVISTGVARVLRNLLHDFDDSNRDVALIFFQGGTNTFTAADNICWDVEVQQTDDEAAGIYTNAGGEVYNNTVWNVNVGATTGDNGYGIRYTDTSGCEVRNNLVIGVTGGVSGVDYSDASPTNAGVSNNISEDSSAPGSDSHTGESSSLFVSTAEGAEHLHLASGATNAIDGGRDLVAQADSNAALAEVDITGRNRDDEGDTWDIGAHEFVSGVLTITPTGISSAEAFGSSTVSPGPVSVSPSGIASAEAIGDATLATLATVTPEGIASAEAFGSTTVTPGTVTIEASGIGSLEAFGSHTVSLGVLTITPTGIASAEAFGSLTVVPGAVTVSPTGIASAEAFGSHTVAPGAVILAPAGIASVEAFGDAVVITGAVVIEPTGIASLEAFGTLTIVGGEELLQGLGWLVGRTLTEWVAPEHRAGWKAPPGRTEWVVSDDD